MRSIANPLNLKIRLPNRRPQFLLLLLLTPDTLRNLLRALICKLRWTPLVLHAFLVRYP